MRMQYDLKTPGVGHRRIAGSFHPSGSAVSASYGVGFTASWVQAGVYRITFDESFAGFVSINVNGQFPATDTATHIVAPCSSSIAGRYVDILHMSSSTPATINPGASDIPAGTFNKIHFDVTVAGSDIPGAGIP